MESVARPEASRAVLVSPAFSLAVPGNIALYLQCGPPLASEPVLGHEPTRDVRGLCIHCLMGYRIDLEACQAAALDCERHLAGRFEH